MYTGETMTKTIRQHSKPLPEETMCFLRGIARDYVSVKNYVYQRYSGIRNLSRLTKVYDILNAMRYCGLRQQLDLPVVYYELAIADAVRDIKSRWDVLKRKLGDLITNNANLSGYDRMYLRTVLKINSTYAAILNRQEYEIPNNMIGIEVDTKRLNNLLCRLTRKYLKTPEADHSDYFRVSPNGYSYKKGALWFASRTPRKRVAVPLKDNQIFDRQLQIFLNDNSLTVAVPVEAKIKQHIDYVNTVYIHIGNKDMFTLANGNLYGKSLSELVDAETERLTQKNKERARMHAAYRKHLKAGNRKKAAEIAADNLGSVKYKRIKEKERAKTTNFINSEINRMLRMEKPKRIVIVKAITKGKTKFYAKAVNRKLSRSFQSYIRERLRYKCKLHSIELVEINAKGTASICSSCGAEGKRLPSGFACENCGLKISLSLNSAKNIEKKFCHNGD